jgi:hypothetical protein
MHPKRDGNVSFINEYLRVYEYDDHCNLIISYAETSLDVRLNEIEVATLRNALTSWKNAKSIRDRKASKNLNNSVGKKVGSKM